MLGRGRIGLTAVLVAALMAVAASPAYAAGKKAGTITSGNTVTLLNTSGFVKVELRCGQAVPSEVIWTNLSTGPLEQWEDVTDTPSFFQHHQIAQGGSQSAALDAGDPYHVEWTVTAGTKVALGQVYVFQQGSSSNCLYSSQIA